MTASKVELPQRPVDPAILPVIDMEAMKRFGRWWESRQEQLIERDCQPEPEGDRDIA